MSSFWNFAFGALLVIIWIVSGGFVTQANVYLGPYKNTDSDLHRAYWFTFWAAFVTWFLVGIFIILVILSVIGVVALFGSGAGEAGVAAEGGAVGAVGAEGAEGAETAEVAKMSRRRQAQEYAKSPQGQSAISTGVSWVTIAFLVFALILVGITGILAAIAAGSMVKSSNYNPSVNKLKTAYTDCIIAASMCLGAGGLLIIGIIVYFVVGMQRKKKIDAEKKYMEQQKQLELAQIEEVKQEEFKEKVAQQAAFKQQLQQAEERAIIQRVLQQGVATTAHQ